MPIQNNTTRLCEACNSPCKTCKNLPTNCSSCTAGYYLDDNKCTTTCAGDRVPDYINQECGGCRSPCSTCTKHSQYCTGCLKDYFLFNNSCFSHCEPTLFEDLEAMVCRPCVVPCLECRSKSNCTSCRDQLLLFTDQGNGTCVRACPDYYYPQGGFCHPCVSPCSKCISHSNCTECVQGNGEKLYLDTNL